MPKLLLRVSLIVAFCCFDVSNCSAPRLRRSDIAVGERHHIENATNDESSSFPIDQKLHERIDNEERNNGNEQQSNSTNVYLEQPSGKQSKHQRLSLQSLIELEYRTLHVAISRSPDIAIETKTVERRIRELSTNYQTARVIVGYKNENGKATAMQVAQFVYHDFPKSHVISISVDAEGMETLNVDDNIISIESDSMFTEQGQLEEIVRASDLQNIHLKYPKLVFSKLNQAPSIVNNDTDYKNNRTLMDLDDYEKIPYGIYMTQADRVDYGYRGRAMVCVVDTGAVSSHPDFDASLLTGSSRESSELGMLLQWNEDYRGHGTHIAGIVSARCNNNYGVQGMGNIPTYITRGLDNYGNARESDVMQAMEQCVSSGSKIISLSLSGTTMSSSMQALLDQFYDNNIMVVAAAGNDGAYGESYPASYSKVVSVGAVGEDENLWENSNYGPAIELTAPGHLVLSTGLYDGSEYTFSFYSGTSMAAPHVAAAAAILWSHYPDCTTTQIRYAMAYTAKDKGNIGCDDYYGFGIVQVKDAFDFLAAHSCSSGYTTWGQDVGDGRCSIIDSDLSASFSSNTQSAVLSSSQSSTFYSYHSANVPVTETSFGSVFIP